MNVSNDIEERLRKIRCSVSREADEQILADATAQFERAAKVRLGRSWGVFVIAAVIVVLIGAVIFLIGRGEAEHALPKTEKQVGPAKQRVEIEEVAPQKQHASKQSKVTQQPKPERGRVINDDPEARLARIASMAAAGDIDGLVAILKTDDFASKMAAVKLLSRMSDAQAVSALNELAGNLDANDPRDHLLAKLLGVEDFGKPEEVIEDAEVETKSQANAEAVNEPNMAVVEDEAEIETGAETEAVNKPDTTTAKQEKPSQQYVTGWLSDVNGYAVEGKIHIGPEQAATDVNGVFSIKPPSFADFISSFGYAVSNDAKLGVAFHWTKDEDLNDVEVVCMEFASASGSVVDVNGDPVADADMTIAPYVDEQTVYAVDKFKGPWQIIADANGTFEILSIPVGYPLALVAGKGHLKAEMPLGDIEPGEHMQLGEIVLEEEASGEAEY